MHNCKCHEPKGANDWGLSYNKINVLMYEIDILKIFIFSLGFFCLHINRCLIPIILEYKLLCFQGSKISEQNSDKNVYPRENKNTICLLKNHFNSNFICRCH